MGVACLEFRGENFRGWLKNREIRESFLPRRFPAIRYVAIFPSARDITDLYPEALGHPGNIVSMRSQNFTWQPLATLIMALRWHEIITAKYPHTVMDP